MKKLAPFAVLLLTTACGGSDSGGGSTITPVINAPALPPATTSDAASPAPAPTPTPTAAPSGPTGPDNVAIAQSLYTTQPSATNCVAGQLKPSVTAHMLELVNTLRALHRLPPVGYSTDDEPSAQQASLMMAANKSMSHTPPTTWKCYTDAGAAAAAASDLSGFTQGASVAPQSDDSLLAGWMNETENVTANDVGHRRWILNPFATTFSYGRTVVSGSGGSLIDYAALKVFNTSGTAPAGGTLPEFVAYPYGDYPARYFKTNAVLSFSAIPYTKTRYSNAVVTYANATVQVAVHGGQNLTVSNIKFDNDGVGLPNNIQFSVAGLKTNVSYDVTIANVDVKGTPKTYTYSFKIVP